MTTEDAVPQQIEKWAESVYEPDDLVELRLIRPADSDVKRKWIRAGELASPDIASWLSDENGQDYGVYVGVSPRNGEGGTDDDVALARCIVADIDGITVEEAVARISESELPEPTAMVFSGGGVHCWWRLDDPILDADEWRSRERWIIDKLGGDHKVKAWSQVLRLPGFVNTKPKRGGAISRLVDVNKNRIYSADEFPRLEHCRPCRPNRPQDPVDPDDPVTPAAGDAAIPDDVARLIEETVPKGPGEHDGGTMSFARGLKFDLGYERKDTDRYFSGVARKGVAAHIRKGLR